MGVAHSMASKLPRDQYGGLFATSIVPIVHLHSRVRFDLIEGWSRGQNSVGSQEDPQLAC